MAALTISVFLMGVPSALLLYHLSEDWAAEDAKSAIRAIQDSKTREIEANLAQAGLSLDKLQAFIAMQMAEPPSLEDETKFALRFMTFPDGSIRTDPKHFDGRVQAGTYIDPTTPNNPYTRAFHARLTPMIELYGAAQLARFDTLWLLTRWRSMMVLMPRIPSYVFDTTPKDDYNFTGWMKGGDPAVNPKRQMYWTDPTYDRVSRSWMVSAVRPLDLDGNWIGTIGHDFFLDGLFERLNDRVYPEAQNFLIDRDGEYILAGPWQGIIQDATYSDAQQAEIDTAMAPVLAALGKAPKDEILQVDFLGQPYLVAANHIAGPEWRLIRLVPVSSVGGSISSAFTGSAGSCHTVRLLTRASFPVTPAHQAAALLA